MRQTAEQVEQQKTDTLIALEKFKEGDRVYNSQTKRHGVYQAPNFKTGTGMPDCWVRFDLLLDEQWFIPLEKDPESTSPLNLELCQCNKPIPPVHNPLPSNISTSSPGLVASALQPNLSEDLIQPNLLKYQAMPNPSLEVTGQTSPSIPTSEITIQENKALISQLVDSPVLTLPALGTELESMENLALSGLKPSELSMNANPDSLSSKTPQDYSIEEWEQSFKAYPKAGIFVNGRLSPQPHLERPIAEPGYLSLPTLTSGDSTPNSRAAGQTKCEIWFRKNGLLADSQCLSPQMMPLLQNFPPDWTKCLLESQEETKDELKADTFLVEQSALPKPPSPCNESSTSTALQELTIDEERDFHTLERKVENAFIKAESVFREAVFALKEIRDRRLYRSSHATFEEYCKERFNFSRRRPYQLIDAAVVLENLANPDLQMCTKTEIGTHLLPTNERQIRDLVDLEPEEQVTVWGKATSNGKVPSGEKIKDTLDAHIRERLNQPPIPTYSEGDVVEIRSGGHSSLLEHDGMWGIVTEVLPSRYKIYISLRNTEVRCKGDELERVDEKLTVEIRLVSDRIKRLRECSLDAAEYAVLQVIAKNTCFSPKQMALLEFLEGQYEI